MNSTQDGQHHAEEDPKVGDPGQTPPAVPAVPTPLKKKPGPKTPVSKSRVRFNAVSTGMHAVTPVIPDLERKEDWLAHLKGIVASCTPVGDLERKLAERVAYLLWRLERVVGAEQAEYDRVNQGASEVRLPPAIELDKIQRIEAHLQRQLVQTLHELEALQKRRAGEATPLARLDVDVQAG